MSDLALRLEAIRERIHRACVSCGRAPESVDLLAVSKFHSVEQVREAAALGLRAFGENYVQAGCAKAEALPDLNFVLIGPLQRNKAKPALLHFRELMTLDRPELALRLRPLAEELNVRCGVWIQLDLWGEATKIGGCPEEGIPALVGALGQDPRLPLQGFMAIPPPGMDTAFLQLAKLRETWQQRLGFPLRLSMGMSDDLEKAILAGTDQVRIGTALFGERA